MGHPPARRPAVRAAAGCRQTPPTGRGRGGALPAAVEPAAGARCTLASDKAAFRCGRGRIRGPRRGRLVRPGHATECPPYRSPGVHRTVSATAAGGTASREPSPRAGGTDAGTEARGGGREARRPAAVPPSVRAGVIQRRPYGQGGRTPGNWGQDQPPEEPSPAAGDPPEPRPERRIGDEGKAAAGARHGRRALDLEAWTPGGAHRRCMIARCLACSCDRPRTIPVRRPKRKISCPVGGYPLRASCLLCQRKKACRSSSNASAVVVCSAMGQDSGSKQCQAGR